MAVIGTTTVRVKPVVDWEALAQEFEEAARRLREIGEAANELAEGFDREHFLAPYSD